MPVTSCSFNSFIIGFQLNLLFLFGIFLQYVEELMLLTLSDVERGIYDNCVSDHEKRQLCCHLKVVDRLQEVVGSQLMSLDEVKVVMISHTKQVSYFVTCVISL